MEVPRIPAETHTPVVPHTLAVPHTPASLCTLAVRRTPPSLRTPVVPSYVGGGRPFNPQAANAYYQFCYGQRIDLHYGDELYRPSMVGTLPGSGEPNVVTEIDPSFSTDEYELSDMQPSPPKENPTPPSKRRGRGKKKGKMVEPSKLAPVGKTKSVNYTPQESMALARCWVDVSEDPIVSNMQTQGGF